MTDDPDAIIARAKGYPFHLPRTSYILVDDRVLFLEDLSLGNVFESQVSVGGETMSVSEATGRSSGAAAASEVRTPILGYGSNAAPVQLQRKMEQLEETTSIPVVRARLKDFDVVYSAHIGRYGPIPATLYPSPGTAVDLFVTFLTDAEAARMFETEHGNYDYVDLRDIEVEIETYGRLTHVRAYLSKYHVLGLTGAPLALEAIAASARALTPVSEPGALEIVARAVAPSLTVDQFILAAATDEDRRREWTAALAPTAIPFSWPDVQIIRP